MNHQSPGEYCGEDGLYCGDDGEYWKWILTLFSEKQIFGK